MEGYIQEIQEKYEKFSKLSFPPGHRSISVSGKTLALIQSEIGGFILSFIETGGALGSRQTKALEQALSELRSVLPTFSEEGRNYFQPLLDIGEQVLRLAHGNPYF